MTLDDSCFDRFAVDGGMLSVVAVCVEESVVENTPSKFISVLAALEKVGNAPFDAFDGDYGGI